MEQGLYENFVTALRAKVSKKSELVQVLADMLRIERESVYRRLRGDVPFTLLEAFTVARNLGVSLDEISHSSSGKKPLYMELSLFRNAKGIEYEKLEQMCAKMRDIARDPLSEHAEALSSISPFLWPQYRQLTTFYSFRELYQYATPQTHVHFKDVQLSDRLLGIQEDFRHVMRDFKTTYYIWDESIIVDLIKDIKYFESIRLIERSNVEALKEELRGFLHQLGDMAERGKYDGTNNKFELYVSNVDIDMTYSYFWSPNACISTFLTFIVRSATTLNRETCMSIKDWVKSLKRVSTLISEAGEKERILFFEKQHQILDTL